MAKITLADLAAGKTLTTLEADDSLLTGVTDLAEIILPSATTVGVTVGSARVACAATGAAGFLYGCHVGHERKKRGLSKFGLTTGG